MSTYLTLNIVFLTPDLFLTS